MITYVQAGGLFSTSASTSVTPLMSLAFCSGVVPSRVIWIVTIGMAVSSSVGLPVAGVRPAVNVQGLAGHEPGRLQVQRRLDDFPDLAHPP